MRHALHERIKPINLITPASRASAAVTHNGQAAGNVGYDLTAIKAREVAVLLVMGTIATGGALAVTLKHGDVIATTDASYVTVVDGAANQAVLNVADTDGGKIYLARLRAEVLKKFLDVQISQTGAVAILYNVVLLFGDSLAEAIAQTAGVVFFSHNP